MSRFQCFLTDSQIWLLCRPYEANDAIYEEGTLRTEGESTNAWTVFKWHGWCSMISLKMPCTDDLLRDYLHPFIDSIYPNNSGFFFSKLMHRVYQNCFEEQSADRQMVWPLYSRDVNSVEHKMWRRDLFEYKILPVQIFSCRHLSRKAVFL